MRDAREIDSRMRHIWLKVVKKEYDNGTILEESNLHSTVYFHLRKLIESSQSKKTKPFIYSEMPFSTTMKAKGKKNPRVDLAVVILKKETPIDLLAVIELKHYDFHANSIGVNNLFRISCFDIQIYLLLYRVLIGNLRTEPVDIKEGECILLNMDTYLNNLSLKTF